MFDASGAYLDAQLFVTNASYSIDLYDPSTVPPTFILTITNSTLTDTIQEDWGVTNANGSPYTGQTVYAYFNVTPVGSYHNNAGGQPPSGPRKILTRGTGQLSEWGPNFDVVYMYTPTNSSLATAFAKDGAIWNGMLAVVNALTMEQHDYDTVYQSFFDHYYCYICPPNERPYPGYITSRDTITNSLLPDMTNGLTKNFFCYAHGTSNWIGNFNGDVYISANEVASWLKNSYTVTNYNNSNPYRFVFLDGCSTAAGKNWQRAFGIPDFNEVARNKTGPQAYVGWANTVTDWLGGNEDPVQGANISKAYTQTLNNFYTLWMRGSTLAECIDNSSLSLYGTAPLPVPQNKNVLVYGDGFNYIGTNLLVAPIYVIGHSGLTVKSIDSRYDKQHARPINSK